jgi:D-3-phosphoglycerate dehydrogenase
MGNACKLFRVWRLAVTGRKPFRIVVAEPFGQEALVGLEAVGEVTVLKDPAPETLIAAVQEADALLIRAKAHVTARIIDSAPRLKVIGRASPTMDHIDLRAASQRAIHVVYSPHAAVRASAEFTLGLILALQRRILFYDRQFRQGQFQALRLPTGRELGQCTVGLLGVDHVSGELGRMISSAFGSRLIYHCPGGRRFSTFEAEAVDLDTLLAEADVLSVHLRLTPQTKGLLNADRFIRMKSSAILVNTSRGAVVDTKALAVALKRRHIAGAALDVFETEPLQADHPLRQAPHCILTPHVAGATLDAVSRRYQVAQDVVRVLKGESPRYPFILPTA